jgi:hypothetical protein
MLPKQSVSATVPSAPPTCISSSLVDTLQLVHRPQFDVIYDRACDLSASTRKHLQTGMPLLRYAAVAHAKTHTNTYIQRSVSREPRPPRHGMTYAQLFGGASYTSAHGHPLSAAPRQGPQLESVVHETNCKETQVKQTLHPVNSVRDLKASARKIISIYIVEEWQRARLLCVRRGSCGVKCCFQRGASFQRGGFVERSGCGLDDWASACGKNDAGQGP